MLGSNLVPGNGLMLMLAGVALTTKLPVRSLGVLQDPGLLLDGQVVVMAMTRWAYQYGRFASCSPSWIRGISLQWYTLWVYPDWIIAMHCMWVCPWRWLNRNRDAEFCNICCWVSLDSIMQLPFLQELHWLPMVFQTQFKMPVFIVKALNGLSPGYLKDLQRSARTSVRAFSGSYLYERQGWWGLLCGGLQTSEIPP